MVTFQRLWKQHTSATANITPWPLDLVVWSFSISTVSPNLIFHLWKKHMKTEFPATGLQPGPRPRGRQSSAQRRANINAVSGGWDKTGGVDNGSCGHTHLLPLHSVHSCFKAFFSDLRTEIFFFPNDLFKSAWADRWDEVTRNTDWDEMHHLKCMNGADGQMKNWRTATGREALPLHRRTNRQ